jgi:hypothetical protein
LCGAEDWDEHLRECNVAMVDQHIDFILVPEGYEMSDGAPDFVVQCPNPEGTATIEYALSEIGLQEDSKDVFFPSKELKSRAKGVALDFSNKDIGTEYGFSITVTDFNDNTVQDQLVLRGLDLQKDSRPTGRRSRGIKNEIVLKPNLKAAVSATPDANLIDIDTTKSLVFVFQLFQNKRDGNEIMQKVVFNARGIMPPGAIFTRGNALGSTGRRFFTTIFTKKKDSVSTPYQTKMQGSLNDVKIAMVFIKDKDRTDATLEDIYFKVPPADFRQGKWDNLNADLEESQAAIPTPIESKVDPYNLIDVTDLCFDLEERIEALGDLIRNEELETYKREYIRNQSRAKHYLTILKPHQADLQAGIGDEFEADYKVLTTISAAQKLEHIDAFFSVSVKAERKKEMKRSGRSNLRTLIKSAKTTIAQGNPKVFAGKFGAVKEFSSRVTRRGRGFRKKFKGRLLAFQDLIHSKKNDQAPPGVSDWPSAQNVQDVLDAIAESLLSSTA